MHLTHSGSVLKKRVSSSVFLEGLKAEEHNFFASMGRLFKYLGLVYSCSLGWHQTSRSGLTDVWVQNIKSAGIAHFLQVLWEETRLINSRKQVVSQVSGIKKIRPL